VILNGFLTTDYEVGLTKVWRLVAENDLRVDRCRESSRRRFDLHSIGGHRYRTIYSRL